MDITFRQNGGDVLVIIDGEPRGILRDVMMTIENTKDITAFMDEYGDRVEALGPGCA